MPTFILCILTDKPVNEEVCETCDKLSNQCVLLRQEVPENQVSVSHVDTVAFYGLIKKECFVERAMDLVRPYALAYWLMLPFYVLYSLFRRL